MGLGSLESELAILNDSGRQGLRLKRLPEQHKRLSGLAKKPALFPSSFRGCATGPVTRRLKVERYNRTSRRIGLKEAPGAPTLDFFQVWAVCHRFYTDGEIGAHYRDG
jgi:hypothetical protein